MGKRESLRRDKGKREKENSQELTKNSPEKRDNTRKGWRRLIGKNFNLGRKLGRREEEKWWKQKNTLRLPKVDKVY